MNITYHFRGEHIDRTFEIALDPVTLARKPARGAARPAWTRRSPGACPGCPLAASEEYCPMALALVDLEDFAGGIDSFAPLHASVVTPERTVRADVSAQRAISALMGLLIATSGCPEVAWLRPMARFHLPFASDEETIYRATSMYLLAQYFRHHGGLPADLDLAGLRAAYQRLHQINLAMSERLKAVVDRDAAINAVVLLDLFAKALPYSIDTDVGELAYLFTAYLATETIS